MTIRSAVDLARKAIVSALDADGMGDDFLRGTDAMPDS